MLSSLSNALLVIYFLLISFSVYGESITVAVASNFHASAVKLAKAFEQKTGAKVKLASGASGVLYAQIIKGAPFDVFLSADKQRPQQLVEQGFAFSHHAYVSGKLALWAPEYRQAFTRNFFSNYYGKLAIANPKLAPYGIAAQQTLSALGVKDSPSLQLITGNNANQVFHFIDSGNVKAGFVPESLLLLAQKTQSGNLTSKYQYYWLVPNSLYQPIEQHAAVIKRSKHIALAKAFKDYLLSAPAQQLLQTMGYTKPLQ